MAKYQGREMAVEPAYRIESRRRSYTWGWRVFLVLWIALAAVAAVLFWNVYIQAFLAAFFGIVALYLFAVARRIRPMVVYEYGIEVSDGFSRPFFPWGRLMWGWEDNEGLHLRRVHGIEAAMKVLDDRPEVVKVLVVPRDLPTYRDIVEYIKRVLPDAHFAQGTKWMWDRGARYR